MDKAELLAKHFAAKMTVEDPRRPPPCLKQEATQTVTAVGVTREKVVQVLRGLYVRRPQNRRHLSKDLEALCKRTSRATLTGLHRLPGKQLTLGVKRSTGSASTQNECQNQISLLSVVGKVFEKVVADEVCRHLDNNNLLSNQKLCFRAGRSTSDLLLLSWDWQDTLNNGLDILVVALDTVGTFDPVWHADLLESCMPRASKETCFTF